MKSYAGQVTVVTGASSALGRRLALDLAARGAAVTAVARREDLLEATGLPYQVCDVADLDGWRETLARTENDHGRIDILVNAAGVERRLGADVVTLDDVQQIMRVNFDAAVAGTLAVLPGMLARGNGVVCNVSSDHGRAPSPGTAAYCASKAALSAFTESLGHETAERGVRLHVLYPGWVPTALGRAAVNQGYAAAAPGRATHRGAGVGADSRPAGWTTAGDQRCSARLPAIAPVVKAFAPRAYAAGIRRAAR